LFEYELPLNFSHDCNLSSTFYSLKSKNEQHFGFLFSNPSDKDALVKTMKQLYVKLRKGKRQIQQLKNLMGQLEITIDNI